MDRRASVVWAVTVLVLLVGSVSKHPMVTTLIRAHIGEPRQVFLTAGIGLGVVALAQPWWASRSRRSGRSMRGV